jgi:hypothetical protein
MRVSAQTRGSAVARGLRALEPFVEQVTARPSEWDGQRKKTGLSKGFGSKGS